MKKWLIPVAYTFVSVVAFLLSGAAGVLGGGDGTGYGGVVIVLCGLAFYFVLVVPVMCLLYSQRCLHGQRSRFLFTIYQSFLIASPYFISFSKGNGIVVYGIILFAWCELWALLGLARFKGTRQNI